MVNGSGFKEPEVNMRKDRTQNTEHRLQTTDYKNHKHIIGSEKGFILVISLLLLLVATVLGITALSTSTTNVMMSGNQRLAELNFSAADGGVSVSVPIINNTAFFGDISPKYLGLISSPLTTDFRDEIHGDTSVIDCPNPSAGCPTPTPDIDYPLTNTNTYIDVDYLYAVPIEGSAIEFASGYDGLGKGAGGGGIGIYYAVTSVGQGLVGSETVVDAVYRYVTQ